MKCLETRQRYGMTWRRRRTDSGRTVTTFEVPETVLRAFGMSIVVKELERFQRGEKARERAAQVRAYIAAHLDQKPTATAAELGITEQRVRQIRQELRKAAR